MKISDVIPEIKPAGKVHGKKAGGALVGNTASIKTGSDTDQVQLSTFSKDVQKMKEIIQETPDVRVEKVQRLKAQIERGEYRVDPYRVADKMLISLLSDNE